MPHSNRHQLIQTTAVIGLSAAILAKIVSQILAAEEKLLAARTRILVRYQQMLNLAVEHSPPKYWAGDGVHPTLAGQHALMVREWRKVTGI